MPQPLVTNSEHADTRVQPSETPLYGPKANTSFSCTFGFRQGNLFGFRNKLPRKLEEWLGLALPAARHLAHDICHANGVMNGTGALPSTPP